MVLMPMVTALLQFSSPLCSSPASDLFGQAVGLRLSSTSATKFSLSRLRCRRSRSSCSMAPSRDENKTKIGLLKSEQAKTVLGTNKSEAKLRQVNRADSRSCFQYIT